jgi:glutamate racemase
VLGCTHFPFLRKQITAFLGPQVAIVDPAPAVARQAARLLAEKDLLNTQVEVGHVAYCTTGDPSAFSQVISRLLGEAPPSTVGLHWRGLELNEAE